MNDYEELIAELDSQGSALEAIREPWVNLWKTLAEFCQPNRQFYAPDDKDLPKEPKVLYNSRGVLALNTAAQSFQGYTANEHSSWFKLGFADPLLIRQPGVADWLEECERILYSVFSRCGAYIGLGELGFDIHGIGTGYLYIEEDVKQRNIIYQCRHPRAICIAEDAHGKTDTLFEDDFMTYKAASQRFGDRLTEQAKDNAKRKPFETLTIRHVTMPMDERYRKYGQRDVNPEMPFMSVWYDKTNHAILDVGGYWEFPYLTVRQAKNSGEEYGRSDAVNALGDIKGANQITKSTLALAQLISNPTMIADEDLEGRDTLLPGGRVYVTGEKKFEPVPLGANYPIGVDREERVEKIIDEHFSVPLYRMMQQAEGKMTAREVIERMGEKAAGLGYKTGRYNTEGLQPLIRRTFNILYRSGRLPKPPRVVLDAKTEGGLDIVFKGFLAQLQERYYQTSGLNASLAYIQAMKEIFGDQVLDNVDDDEFMREGLESAGSPAKVIRELPDVETRRAQRAQALAAQQQQMMQFQSQQSLMQNADKLGQRPQPGSPLEQVEAATA